MVACDAAPGCDSFAYNRAQQKCFLKSGATRRTCGAAETVREGSGWREGDGCICRVGGVIACIGSSSSMHLTDLLWYNLTPVFHSAAARTGVRQRSRLALLMRHLADVLQEGWRQYHGAAAGWQHCASQGAAGGGLCSSAGQPMRKPGPSAAHAQGGSAATAPPSSCASNSSLLRAFIASLHIVE